MPDALDNVTSGCKQRITICFFCRDQKPQFNAIVNQDSSSHTGILRISNLLLKVVQLISSLCFVFLIAQFKSQCVLFDHEQQSSFLEKQSSGRKGDWRSQGLPGLCIINLLLASPKELYTKCTIFHIDINPKIHQSPRDIIRNPNTDKR